jgi:hypothetical protein
MTVPYQPPPEWFDIQKYELKEENLLDFEGWRTQIGTRVALAGWLASGMPEEFDRHFGEIQQAPFFDIGFSDSYAFNEAAYPLTWGKTVALYKSLEPLNLTRSDNCDQQLQANGNDELASHMHLTIDLNASETEVISQLKPLLESAKSAYMEKLKSLRPPVVRKSRSSQSAHAKKEDASRLAGITTTVIKSWKKHQILPYEDLRLWHQRWELEMPTLTLMADWLFGEKDGNNYTVTASSNKAEEAFTLVTLRKLSFACASEKDTTDIA